MKLGFSGLHPITQLIFYIAVFVFSLTATHPLCLFSCFLCASFYYIKLQGKTAIRFLKKAVLPLILLSSLINGLFNNYGHTVLFMLPWGEFTLEALIYGLVFALRAGCVLMWLGSFNEILTSDKIVFLFGKISPKIAVTVSMSLRFIPLIFRQSEEIEKAAKGIGEKGASGNFIEKVKSASKRLSILVTWTLERGIDTMNSMKARGYGLKGRTSHNSYTFSLKDLFFFISVLSGAVSFFFAERSLNSTYIPVILIPFPEISDIIFSVFVILLMLSPLIFDIKEEKKWSISV